VQTCDYIIHLEVNENDDEPNYSERTDEWNKVICKPFLDPNKNSNKIVGSFYIPSLLLEKLKIILNHIAPSTLIGQNMINEFDNLKWGNYCLLKKVSGYGKYNILIICAHTFT